MSAAESIRSFAKKAGGIGDAVVRKVVIDFTTDLVRATPVDTGNARSNWFWGLQRESSVSAGSGTMAKAVDQFSGSFMGPMTLKDRDAITAMKWATGKSTDKQALKAAKSQVGADKSGKDSIARGMAFSGSVTSKTPEFWITNNVEYIMALEYGHSKQAPAGMARITADRWQIIINKAAQVFA